MIQESIKMRLLRCAVAGMTRAEAARELEYTPSGICRLLQRHNIVLKAAHPSAETWPKIRELAEAGLNRNEIVARLGISRRKIDYFAQKNPDVRIVAIRRRNGPDGAVTPQKRVDYTDGLTDQQIKDCRTLMRKAGVTAEEARATVLRPRRKLSALPRPLQRRRDVTPMERLREGARA